MTLTALLGLLYIHVTQANKPETIGARVVVQTHVDTYGEYKVLDTGTTLRDVPPELEVATTSAYATHPELPKGIVEAILQKESSMGTDMRSYNPNIGKYAWLVGFTDIAKQELLRNGFDPDLDSPNGAIRAMADYIYVRQYVRGADAISNNVDPVELYDKSYSSGKLPPQALETFNDLVQYYASK